MDSNLEYQKIKSFFIIIFSITTVFIAIVVAFSYNNIETLKTEFRVSLENNEKKIDELFKYSEKVIERTESRGIIEIGNIKNSVRGVATTEAKNRINEIFQYGHMKLLVEEVANKSLAKEIDKIVAKKMNEAETQVNELIDALLGLLMHIDQITNGSLDGLTSLKNIIKREPNSNRGKFAKKILKMKSVDYRQYFENKFENDLNQYLDFLNISKQDRKDKDQLILSIIKVIQKKDQWLHAISVGVLAIEKLVNEEIDIFDLERIEEIRKKHE